jgi:hypothetical protein
MNKDEIINQIIRKRAAGDKHVMILDRRGSATVEEMLLENSNVLPFTWHDIVFYRENGKKVNEQPITVDEVKTCLRIVPVVMGLSMLASLLHKDMAYEHELMPLKDAEKLASKFVGIFDSDADIYTNTCSLTDSTFDSGLIIIDKTRFAIVWFEDED